MYNIIQLNDKDLSELQSIAKELGIKNADSLKKDQLVYDILDEQAVRNAAKKSSASNEGINSISRCGIVSGNPVYSNI